MMMMTYSSYRKFSSASSLRLTWSWKPTSSLPAIPSETFLAATISPTTSLLAETFSATTVSQTTSLLAATFSEATPP